MSQQSRFDALVRDLEALTRQEASGRPGSDVSCGGYLILSDGCHAGMLAQQVLDVLAKHARPQLQCWCVSCADYDDSLMRIMHVCPDCGSKRCPRAAHHQHRCVQPEDKTS